MGVTYKMNMTLMLQATKTHCLRELITVIYRLL